MKKEILILTVILFTLTANAKSFYHTLSSSGSDNYYSQDIYIDAQASVTDSVDGGMPTGGLAAELSIFQL